MNNEKLAFDIAIKSMEDYAKQCKKEKNHKMMNPIEGTYLLVSSLALGLLYKSDDFLDDCKELMHEAIDDAFKIVKDNNHE